MVQLLRFSNYLFGLICDEQIDYSALRVVVGWANESLKTASTEFESIIALVEKLDNIVRLSSGWGLYDIWNAFLTNVTPPTVNQSLEVLEKISSIGENIGK